ncbi:hypothetical protein GCM10009828_019510 [Actinoplanes couchii]|uniref:CU044_5270 family protein n=1 Tax=Actinoplanes couchii TaxID=403638 RepID=A0ABQ3XDQ2_9ACTN|nr:hypothetical protein Aco03nite_050180 [Actinoplanes couchii]
MQPLSHEAHQRARSVLRAAMQDPGTVRLLGVDKTEETTSLMDKTTRRRRGFGIGAGVGVAAAAAAIAALFLNTSAPGATMAGADAPPAAVATADAPLMTLAGSIKTVAFTEGDAWLVKATQVHGTRTMQVLYTLYTDGHAIYSGNSVADIKRAMKLKQDQMTEGGYAPLLKAAVAAADDSPADGRDRMLETGGDPFAGLDAAAQEKQWAAGQAEAQARVKEKGGTYTPKPYSPEAVERHLDNALWTYSTQALGAGDGNTQVRSGVLRLLSTIAAVEVTKSTTGGTATLTLTAGPEVFGGEGDEVLIIDAKTGMLVESVSTVPGIPVAKTTYESTRVTAADLS